MKILIYFLTALAGGVFASLGLFLALVYASRNSDATFISFGRGNESRLSRDCDLIESEKREGGVYVKVRNRSPHRASMFSFTIKVFDADGMLVDQIESTLYADVAPGAIEEAIVKPEDYRNPQRIDLTNRRIDVKLKNMYIETKAEQSTPLPSAPHAGPSEGPR